MLNARQCMILQRLVENARTNCMCPWLEELPDILEELAHLRAVARVGEIMAGSND